MSWFVDTSSSYGRLQRSFNANSLYFYDYAELVEPLSLDETFLGVTDSEHCGGSATNIVELIRRHVYEAVKLTVSAGMAPNKFSAKIASERNKPNGLFVITPKSIDNFVLIASE